jgi:hypothetical protein
VIRSLLDIMLHAGSQAPQRTHHGNSPGHATTWAIALCAALYLYVFPYQAQINNPNENVRFYMTAAIVDDATYAINGPRKRWGWVNDAGVRDGEYYSVKAPGTSLLGVPGYALYRAYTHLFERPFDRVTALWWCRVTAGVLPTLLWLYFLHRYLHRFTSHPVLRDATFFSIALGSLLYGYALLFVSHTLSAVVAFSVFLVLDHSAHRPRARAFLAGLFAGAVTWFEYPGLVPSVVLASYALLRVGWRRAPWLCAGGLIPALSMMHFHFCAWGNPFLPGHRFLENPAYRALSQEGFYGATGINWRAAGLLLFDRGYGLVPLTPILGFAVLGSIVALRDRARRHAAVAALSVAAGTLVAISFMNNWRGGWTIGPRYLAVVVPFLGWLALIGLDVLAGTSLPLAYGAALATSCVALVLSGAVSAYYPHVPESMLRPLRDLVEPLVRYDFAPHNVANLFGLYGTESMLPWALLLMVVIATLVVLAMRRSTPLQRVMTLLIAVCMAGPLGRASLAEPTETNHARSALALVTRSWEPSGHDTLAALLRERAEARDAVWARRVMHTYRALGRENEARAFEDTLRTRRKHDTLRD